MLLFFAFKCWIQLFVSPNQIQGTEGRTVPLSSVAPQSGVLFIDRRGRDLLFVGRGTS